MLFDDLPATKIEGKDNPPKSTAGGTNTKDLEESKLKTTSSDATQTPEKKKETKGKSVVGSLGNAGTTMAFLPAALRKRKPLPTKAVQSQQMRRSKAPVVSEKSQAQEQKSDSFQKAPVPLIGSDEETSKQNPDSSSITLPCHDGEEENESQELRDLHASIHPADMYNPMMPNDYLAYRQMRENELIRVDLEKQAMKTMEMQQKLRSQIEEERQKAIQKGDFDKVVGEDVARMGRGRGRGMSNLPAWLVKKQQEQKRNGPTGE